MSDNARPDNAAARLDEERLAHALVSRGLLTREEVDQVRPAVGAEALLRRLVEVGYLTEGQARRSTQDLPLLLGQQIPGYALLQKLGQGATGTVYKARQLSMNRLVAVKILAPRLASNPEYLDRNFGGVLIVFDRIFGSFAAERHAEPCRYGLVQPLSTHNLLRIEFHAWRAMFRDLAKARGLREIALTLLGPPEWHPAAAWREAAPRVAA